ncbi:hypothetical protein ACVV2G_03220 [Streptomyces ziwulingensis]
MSESHGFAFTATASGTVRITHHSRPATTLNGSRAARFLQEVPAGDPHLVMARRNDDYGRGTERTARDHPATAVGRDVRARDPIGRRVRER